MIQTPGYLSSAAYVPVGARSDYFASSAHYEAVARRIVASLRGGSGPFVLVTGDPPANSQVLSAALGNVAGPGYAVIIISCGLEWKRDDLERAVPTLAKRRDTSKVAAEPESLAPASPLFVFDDFDRLSDEQIKDICDGTLRCDRMPAAGVLLAPPEFLARLERPALHVMKKRLAARRRSHCLPS